MALFSHKQYNNTGVLAGNMMDALRTTLNNLEKHQIELLHKELFALPVPVIRDRFYQKKDEKAREKEIYDFLIEVTKEKNNEKEVDDNQIIFTWLKEVEPVIRKINIQKQKKDKQDDELEAQRHKLEAQRHLVLSDLFRLGIIEKEPSKVNEKLESIVRTILLLLPFSDDINESKKEEFYEKLIQNTEQFQSNTKNEIRNKLINDIAAPGGTSLLPVAAVISAKTLSGSFILVIINVLAWFGIGGGAVVTGVLGFLTGPWGWGLAILALMGSGSFIGLKMQSARNKQLFIQTIFSIYALTISNKNISQEEAI